MRLESSLSIYSINEWINLFYIRKFGFNPNEYKIEIKMRLTLNMFCANKNLSKNNDKIIMIII
jgi:hypothetical protein